MILRTCGYEYSPRIERDVQRARDFMATVTTPNEVRGLLSAIACSFSARDLTNQLLFLHQGRGSNSKSATLRMAQNALGNYASTLNIEQLTNRSTGRNEANSELAGMPGKRLAQFNEPENQVQIKLQCSRIKELSGEKNTSTRDVYGQKFLLEIHFMIHILCNKLPMLSSKIGNAERRRFVVIKYPYEFKEADELDPENPTHRLKNPALERMIATDESFKFGFLYMCLEHWKEIGGVFKHTEGTRLDTMAYLASCEPEDDSDDDQLNNSNNNVVRCAVESRSVASIFPKVGQRRRRSTFESESGSESESAHAPRSARVPSLFNEIRNWFFEHYVPTFPSSDEWIPIKRILELWNTQSDHARATAIEMTKCLQQMEIHVVKESAHGRHKIFARQLRPDSFSDVASSSSFELSRQLKKRMTSSTSSVTTESQSSELNSSFQMPIDSRSNSPFCLGTESLSFQEFNCGRHCQKVPFSQVAVDKMELEDLSFSDIRHLFVNNVFSPIQL